MCAVGAALEFGVELYAHMEITAGQLNSFYQAAVSYTHLDVYKRQK